MQRRKVIAGAAGVLAGTLAGCTGELESQGEQSNNSPTTSRSSGLGTIPEGQWPQIGFDSKNSRFNAQSRGPRSKPEVVWTSLGDRPVYPPVVKDYVFLSDAWASGNVFAIGRHGALQWENSNPAQIRWAPALWENNIFILARTDNKSVGLYALDQESGELQWFQKEGITASNSPRPPQSPTVHKRTLFIASERGIMAVNANDGTVDWEANLGPKVVETEDGPSWITIWAKPSVSGDFVYSFDMNDSHGDTRKVYAVNRHTGQQNWTASLETGDRWALQGYVVAGTDQIFVSAREQVERLDEDGEDSNPLGDQRLFAIDAKTGEIAWEQMLPGPTLLPPAFADGILYIGGWDTDAKSGYLHAIEKADGGTLWGYSTDTGPVCSPTITRDTIYFGQDNELVALKRSDGEERWNMMMEAQVGHTVVVGDVAFIQTNSGRDKNSKIIAVHES